MVATVPCSTTQKKFRLILLCISKATLTPVTTPQWCEAPTVDAATAGCAGQYNEQVFKAIDFILNEMGKQGIKVIVALVDYWKKTDGVQQVGSLRLSHSQDDWAGQHCCTC